MADRYNVDDILEEIKRKKSGAGSMISRQDAGGTAEERPVYSRYGDEADYDAPRSRRGYDDGYDSRYDERPRRRYDSYDSYDEEDRPRRRAAYDEERYDERPSRRSYEGEDRYERAAAQAEALLATPGLKEIGLEKQKKLLSEKVDINGYYMAEMDRLAKAGRKG